MNKIGSNRENLIYIRRCCLLVICFLMAISTITKASINITRTSSDQFYLNAGDSVQCQYASYQIENTDSISYTNVWVEITDFTGGVVSLSPLETNYYTFNMLGPGETKTAFFYLQASEESTILQEHTINVYEGDPFTGTLLASSSFGFTEVRGPISASANRVTVIVAGPIPPVVGGVLTITVDGSTGTIGGEGVMSFSPACFLDWPAYAYQLVSTEITLTGGNNTVLTDQLYYSAPSSQNTDYHSVYTFKVINIAVDLALTSPVAVISSGNVLKHNKTNSYFIINPIEPPGNYLILTKTAYPVSLTGSGTVTYSLILQNSGIFDVTTDAVEDRLPISPDNPAYVSGTTEIDGVPASDPVISGSILYWPVNLSVPAGGSTIISFDASFSSVEGNYLNEAMAFIGTVQIDTTLVITDDAPATALVVVGPPDIVMLKTVQTYSDPVNDSLNPKSIPGASMLYTVQISNQGAGAADSNSIIVSDQIPGNASLYVGDIDSSGSGPVYFEDGSTASGLSFTYSGLSSLTDDVSFSSDSGFTFNYIPSPDPDGYDINITNIMINPKGEFSGALGGNTPSFSLKFKIRIQ